MLFQNKLAIVIATKDRPHELQRLLSSINGQSWHPQQVLVVDGSDQPVQDVVTQAAGLTIDYLRVYPPALTKQKNAGVTAVRPEINLIGFVDDDMVFADGSLEAMMLFWEHAPDAQGGAAFNLTGYNYAQSRLSSLSKRLFFIDNREFGRVLRSGFNTPIWDTKEDRSCDWLGGGYTVWRRGVFDHWKFNEWFRGSGLWEDVFFSYQVGKRYQFTVVAEARAESLEVPLTQSGQVRVGKTQMLNWVYFVKSNRDLSIAMCLWGCVGRTISNLVKGILTFDFGLVLRGLGNIMGLGVVLAQTINPLQSRATR